MSRRNAGSLGRTVRSRPACADDPDQLRGLQIDAAWADVAVPTCRMAICSSAKSLLASYDEAIPDRHDAAAKGSGDTLAGLRLFELERRIGRMEAFLLGGLAMLGSLSP